MATLWNSPFKVLPTNGQTVWIRVLTIFGELAIAKYDVYTQTFEVLSTGLIIPAFQVARWKVYP